MLNFSYRALMVLASSVQAFGVLRCHGQHSDMMVKHLR